jgi:hypothetical protein
MSQQSDNVLFWQNKNVRFLKNELRFFFTEILEENLNERGHYHDEFSRGKKI